MVAVAKDEEGCGLGWVGFCEALGSVRGSIEPLNGDMMPVFKGSVMDAGS